MFKRGGHHGVDEAAPQLGFVNELACDVQAGKGSFVGLDVKGGR